MRIFSTDENNRLVEIRQKPFILESEIKKITEANLDVIFKLELVKSEYELHGLRIDTLAFDKELSSFVIIEYKRERNFSIIDQGVSYLNLMLNNKADFILEYNQSISPNLKKVDIDWSQSTIIFIAPEFTKYQYNAVGFRGLGIRLWEIIKYDDGLIGFREVQPLHTKESVSAIPKLTPEVKKVSKEIHPYSEESLLASCGQETTTLYSKFKEALLSLGSDIEVRPKKNYISFRKNTSFLGIHFSKTRLRIYLNIDIKEVEDPKKILEPVPRERWTRLWLRHGDEIPYIMSLAAQTYKQN